MPGGNSRNLNGTGHNPGGGIGPPTPKPKGGNLGGSPGLLTSTGGLFGNTGALLIPYMDTLNDRFFAAIMDPSNFDCENDAFYFFRQEDIVGGEQNLGGERNVTVHRAYITYREIGKAKFTFGVSVYSIRNDSYSNIEKTFVISKPNNRKVSEFPDFKLHTRPVSFVITGIRPQAYIKRNANDGPFSITKVRLLYDAQETTEA